MGARYSPLSAFLHKEVPGWDDDVICNARFKAFGSRTDEGWKERMEFWMALIIRGARQLGLVVISANEVKKTWFLRKGLTPLGLDDVLLEMESVGHVQRPEELYRRASTSWFTWSLTRMTMLMSWAGKHILSSPAAHETAQGKYVIMQLLKEKVEDVLQDLQLVDGSTVPSDRIVTMEKFIKACGSYEEANLVLSYLILDRKAQRFSAQGKDSIEGLKFTVRAAKDDAVSENDRRILVLHHTASLLQHRCDHLGQRAEESRQAASVAAKAKDKVVALRHLRRHKTIASSRDSCLRFLEKIEHVLGVISEAETSKQVVDAMRVGAEALKEKPLTIDEVESTMQEINAAMSMYQEVETALGVPAMPDEEAGALEEEFAQLEAQLVGEQPLLEERISASPIGSAAVAMSVGQKSPTKVSSEEVIEQKQSKPEQRALNTEADDVQSERIIMPIEC